MPDKLKLNDVLANIEKLGDGEFFRLSSSSAIVRIAGVNILIDPALQGRSFTRSEPNKLIPPSKGEASKSVKSRSEDYPYSMIVAEPPSEDDRDKSNTQRVGEALANHIDIVTISHLDADHYDFEFIRTMMENNEKLRVYGPLAWQGEIGKHHSLEETGNQPAENYLPKKLARRLRGLSPKPSDPEKDKGLSYPGFNLNMVNLVVTDRGVLRELNPPFRWGTAGESIPPGEKIKEQIVIKSLDVPHMGGLPAEYNQGLVIENKQNRIMIIPDAALSPEIIQHLIDNYEDESGNKLTKIIVSVATLNPETFYGLPKPLADTIRDEIEESIAHSAYLPLVITAMTDGKVPVYLTHGGFYFRSSSDRKYLRTRFPEYKGDDNPSVEEWLSRLKNEVEKTMKDMKTDIDKLGPLATSFEKRSRLSLRGFAKDFPTRRKFATKIVKWIKKTGVPQSIIDNIHMPPANVIISGPEKS